MMTTQSPDFNLNEHLWDDLEHGIKTSCLTPVHVIVNVLVVELVQIYTLQI